MANPADSDEPVEPAYGTARARRASVSYSEVERAATALLKAGKRPTIEGLRELLKGGAPDTIAGALSRYWRDLGTRIEGDAAAMSRLPAEVADLAESIWQRALTLAADAAEQRLGTDREQVDAFRRRNELHSHSLSLREKELDALVRTRERTVQELEAHLRTVMGMLAQKDETIRALDLRLRGAQADTLAAEERLEQLVRQSARPRPARAPRIRGAAKVTAKRRPGQTGKAAKKGRQGTASRKHK
jgi:hypothetical protein